MKNKVIKFFAAAVGMVLAVVITVSVVMESTLDASAADTFLGIQNLIREVQEGKTYTVLEVVPDQAAAEIGFLFAGQEPILSVWSDAENRLIPWQERLAEFPTFEERKNFIEGLKTQLKAYFAQKGLAESDYPVAIASDEYEESAVAAAGYQSLTVAGAISSFALLVSEPVAEPSMEPATSGNDAVTEEPAIVGGNDESAPEEPTTVSGNESAPEETTTVSGNEPTAEPATISSGEPAVCNDVMSYAADAKATTIYYKNTFESKEWFKTYVLNMTSAEYKNFSVKVLTLTPSQINSMAAAGTLANLNFDFLYMGSGAGTGTAYSAANDFSTDAVKQLFTNVVAKKIPCLLDGNLFSLSNTTNVFRLAAMFGQTSPEAFYNAHSTDLMSMDINTLLTGMAPGYTGRHFTTENVYCCNKAVLNSDFYKATIYKAGGQLPEGFKAVLDEITLENLYRESEGIKPLPTDISEAVAIRHIVNYARRRATESKKYVRVLEIEPAKVDAPVLTLAQLQQWLPGVEKADITTMTTAEFIGRTDRLNENYDLIYIGASTAHMNVAGGSTVFNDASMNGLIYYNIGDLRGGTMPLAGVLSSEWTKDNRGKAVVYYYNFERYGGNDITKEKKEELLSFLGGASPVIVADALVKQSAPGQRAVDDSHVDNCSQMYDFLVSALQKNANNLYTWTEVSTSSELFGFYLNRPKVALSGQRVSGSLKENVYYVSPTADGRYMQDYTFTIQNGMAGVPYSVRFYTDVNGDGRFTANEQLASVAVTADGAQVPANALYNGKEYVLRAEIPENCGSLISWQAEIVQNTNINAYTSMKGYTALEGRDRESMRILQIGGPSLNADAFRALIYGGSYGGVSYPGITDEYDVDITVKTIAEFETEYSHNANYLDSFNLLVLGSGDTERNGSFSGDAATGPMGAIAAFANSGRSVVLTHDAASTYNFPAGTDALQYRASWGGSTNIGLPAGEKNIAYSLNRYLRGIAGMDYYGATTGASVNVAFKPKSGKATGLAQIQGFTYTSINAKDDNKGSFTADELGSAFTNKYLNLAYGSVFYADNSFDNGEITKNNNGEVQNLMVTRTNAGQITEYPYRISTNFEIAPSHAPAYLLDLVTDADLDGRGDATVWYCLGGRTNGSQTIYSMSPNDAANNYYVYTKGNITYNGIGHSGGYTLEEAKLFVNTLVTAYRTGIKQPKVEVLESGNKNAAKLTTMYRFYDSQNGFSLEDELNEGDKEKIFFTVQDNNYTAGSRRIEGHIWMSDDAGTETINTGGEAFRVTRLADEVYNLNGSRADVTNLRNGGVYYILVPASVLENCDEGLHFFFGAKTTAVVGSKTFVTGTTYAKLSVYRAYLYDLE